MATGPGSLSRHNHLSEFGTPLQTAAGIKTAAQRRVLALGNLGITASAATLNAAAAGTRGVVVIPDATPYTVLAANSGKTHIIAEQASSITLNLPVIAAGLQFEFIMGGVATEAQNWVFVGTTPSFWNGGVVWLDLNGGPAADEVGVVYGNGSSHLTLTVTTPAAGTKIEVYANATPEWVVNGQVVSDSTPAFS